MNSRTGSLANSLHSSFDSDNGAGSASLSGLAPLKNSGGLSGGPLSKLPPLGTPSASASGSDWPALGGAAPVHMGTLSAEQRRQQVRVCVYVCGAQGREGEGRGWGWVRGRRERGGKVAWAGGQGKGG